MFFKPWSVKVCYMFVVFSVCIVTRGAIGSGVNRVQVVLVCPGNNFM